MLTGIFFLVIMPYINLVKKTKKKIFITGAAGFIGSNVLEYLFKKYKNYYFTVLDALTYAGNLRNFLPEMMNDKRFHFVYGDVTNNALVDNLVRDSDVLGTQSVANAVYHHKKSVERFIHISTCEVYGHGLTRKIDESHPLNPHSPYAAAKAGADRLVYSYYITYGIPVIILRPFN